MAVHFKGPILNNVTHAGSRAFFSDLPAGVVQNDYVVRFNDFLLTSENPSFGTFESYDEIKTGTGTIAQAADAKAGGITLTTSGASGDIIGYFDDEASYALTGGTKLWFEAKCTLGSVANVKFGLGLASSTTSIISNTNKIAMIFDTANSTSGTQWICQNTASSTSTTTASGVTASAASYVVGFRWDGSAVYYYLNRSLVATHTTNIPTAALGIQVLVHTTAVATKALAVDYHMAVQER